MNNIHQINISEDRFLNITVQKSSNFDLDPNLLHPHVKVHITSFATGSYLKKADVAPFQTPTTKAVYHYERVTTYKRGAPRSIVEADFILPASTNSYDMRQHGKYRGEWDMKLTFNCSVAKLMELDTLILVEILDFNIGLLETDKDSLSKDNLYRVAWGYLRLNGLSAKHLGDVKLQLYQYIFISNKFAKTPLAEVMYDVPDVYYDFLWPEKRIYNGFIGIGVSSSPVPKKVKRVREGVDPMHVFERDDESFAAKSIMKTHAEIIR